jgi:hypothetical protein
MKLILENWRNYEQEATTLEAERLFFVSSLFLESLFDKNLSRQKITEYTKNHKFSNFINYRFINVLPSILNQTSSKGLLAEALQNKVSSCLDSFFLIGEEEKIFFISESKRPEIILEFVGKIIEKVKNFIEKQKNKINNFIEDFKTAAFDKFSEEEWKEKGEKMKKFFKFVSWVVGALSTIGMMPAFAYVFIEYAVKMIVLMVSIVLKGASSKYFLIAAGAAGGAVLFATLPAYLAALVLVFIPSMIFGAIGALSKFRVLLDAQSPSQLVKYVSDTQEKMESVAEKLKQWSENESELSKSSVKVLAKGLEAFNGVAKAIMREPLNLDPVEQEA